jgi:hypothetical protein
MIFSSRGSRPHFRVWLTISVGVLWVALMAWLIRDRYFPGNAGIDEGLQIAQTESDDWFLVRIGGAYAGVGRSRQIRKENHWTIRDELNLSLNLQGTVKPVNIVSESDVDDGFRLIAFHLKVSSGIIAFEQKGRMQGRELIIEIPSSLGGGTKRLKLAEAPRISRSLGMPVPLKGLDVGAQIRMPIFEPMDGGKAEAVLRVLEKADLEVAGQKVEAWRVRASLRSLDITMWVDTDGRLLKGVMPLGITVIRAGKSEIAREMKGVRNLPDLVSLAAVPVDGPLPDPDSLTFVRFKVQGGDWSIPSDGFRQSFNGSELTVRKEPTPEAGYSLPWVGKGMQEYLSATRFIMSDHSEIIKAAREIVGGEKDPVKAARLINSWVFKNLKKVPTPSVPDAYTVLVTRQGDCNEHAVLAVALARAVGLPARIAVGLVRMNEGFFYHAWVTYWGGEQWFTGDPMMDLVPVDLYHIALLYGDVDKHLNVIAYLGRLRLIVLETG